MATGNVKICLREQNQSSEMHPTDRPSDQAPHAHAHVRRTLEASITEGPIANFGRPTPTVGRSVVLHGGRPDRTTGRGRGRLVRLTRPVCVLLRDEAVQNILYVIFRFSPSPSRPSRPAFCGAFSVRNHNSPSRASPLSHPFHRLKGKEVSSGVWSDPSGEEGGGGGGIEWSECVGPLPTWAPLPSPSPSSSSS